MVKQEKAMAQVIERLNTGHRAAGVQPRIWWISSDNRLVCRVSPDEIDALNVLKKSGVLESE